MLLAVRSPGHCPQCRTMRKTEIGLFSGPLILPTLVFGVKGTTILSVPEILHLRDYTYTLSACIYGDNSHFVSIVRDFSSDRLLFCDGMSNNAQFTEYKASAGKFPMAKDKMMLYRAYFVRSEYTITTNNIKV